MTEKSTQTADGVDHDVRASIEDICANIANKHNVPISRVKLTPEQAKLISENVPQSFSMGYVCDPSHSPVSSDAEYTVLTEPASMPHEHADYFEVGVQFVYTRPEHLDQAMRDCNLTEAQQAHMREYLTPCVLAGENVHVILVSRKVREGIVHPYSWNASAVFELPPKGQRNVICKNYRIKAWLTQKMAQEMRDLIFELPCYQGPLTGNVGEGESANARKTDV